MQTTNISLKLQNVQLKKLYNLHELSNSELNVNILGIQLRVHLFL